MERIIREANYYGLCKYSDADLTTQQIAGELDLNKATIHSSSGESLIEAALEYFSKRCLDRTDGVSGTTAYEWLAELLIVQLVCSAVGSDLDFQTTLFNVRAQVLYGEDRQEVLSALDNAFISFFLETISNGIDEVELDDCVDPELAAAFLTTSITDTDTWQVAVRHPSDRPYESARTGVDTHLGSESAVEVTT